MRRIQDLKESEARLLVETIYNWFYLRQDVRGREYLVPDQEVSGGDLVEVITDCFEQFEVVPQEVMEVDRDHPRPAFLGQDLVDFLENL